MHKPRSNEYPSYYNRYINLIDSDDILTVLESQKQEFGIRNSEFGIDIKSEDI
jgi:hypothetical protein